MRAAIKILLLSVLIGIRQLHSNWMRTGASLLGMAVAVASVIVMVSIGAGARQSIRDHVASEGVNVIYVWSTLRNVSGVRMATGTKTSLTIEDAVDLKAAIPQLRETCWWRQDPSRVVYGNANWMARVLSVSPSCQSVKNWLPERGSEMSQDEFDAAAHVAMLGQTVAYNLFHGDDPIGTIVRIRNVPFRVIGVLKEKGLAPSGYDQDDIVLIPYSTSKQQLLRPTESHIEMIAVATYEREQLPEATESIKDLLRIRHRIEPRDRDDFTVRNQLDVETLYDGASETLTWLLAAVASISLLVGGIGIMNTLLMSVTSRTREIGVRMAVGAKRGHILIQFLIEAMLLSVMGGSIGVLFGIVGAQLITLIAGWPTLISGNTVIAAVLFSLTMGLFFGLYPANRAAQLNPIEALRYE